MPNTYMWRWSWPTRSPVSRSKDKFWQNSFEPDSGRFQKWWSLSHRLSLFKALIGWAWWLINIILKSYVRKVKYFWKIYLNIQQSMIWKFREMLTESNWIHMRAFFKLEKFEELISSSHHNKVANSTFLSQQKFEMGNHVLSELVAVFRDRLSDLNFEPGIHGPKCFLRVPGQRPS